MYFFKNIFRYTQNTKNTKKNLCYFRNNFFFGENFVQNNCGKGDTHINKVLQKIVATP